MKSSGAEAQSPACWIDCQLRESRSGSAGAQGATATPSESAPIGLGAPFS
ncbi:MAG: hypothetical protein QOI42_1572 [Frankiaceae bacterium]|jgi:hypothetical protein|nr:hypothetical protein [Frankiaceae bacterium]